MSEQRDSPHKIPKLDNDNYYAWSYRMEMKLRKQGVWNIVNGTESRPVGSDNHKVVKAWQTRVDLALSEIIGEVSDSQLVHTRVSRDPAEIWERLQATHVSQGLGSIIAIWQHFFTLKKADNTLIQAHTGVIRELADRLTGLGWRRSWSRFSCFPSHSHTALSLFLSTLTMIARILILWSNVA